MVHLRNTRLINLNLKLLMGSQAELWLSDPANLADWRSLQHHTDCKAPYLSPLFCCIWLQHYSDACEPLLVIGKNFGGGLRALMPLVHINGTITGVGSHQAEYQGWICHPEDSDGFFNDAIAALMAAYPEARLRLKYILPGHCADTLKAYCNHRLQVRLVCHRRPLLTINPETIRTTLKKKSNRSKFNRLNRLGHLQLKWVTNIDDFDHYMDTVFAAYDLRQGAQNNVCPFFEEPIKRWFHRHWFDQCPDDIILSLLTLDDRPIAAFFGVVIDRVLVNAIVAHDPRLSAHSASKLHIYMLAEKLAEMGFTHLDLTPGGDEWKDRFATEYHDVYEFNCWAISNVFDKLECKEQFLDAIKKTLAVVGVTPNHLRNVWAQLKRATPWGIAIRLKSLLWNRTEYRIYKLPITEVTIVEPEVVAHVDELGDLVAFDPAVVWLTRQKFLADASERMAHGEIVYTVRAGDTLIHYGWLNAEQAASFFTEVDYTYEYPEPGAVLYDFFTHPMSRGRQLYQKTVRQMLNDLATRLSPPAFAYISVLADNAPSRHVIEKVGFQYHESIVRLNRLFWVTRYIRRF